MSDLSNQEVLSVIDQVQSKINEAKGPYRVSMCELAFDVMADMRGVLLGSSIEETGFISNTQEFLRRAREEQEGQAS